MYSVFGKSSKVLTSRTFHEIAKLSCNLLDISTSHEYASIYQNWAMIHDFLCVVQYLQKCIYRIYTHMEMVK